MNHMQMQVKALQTENRMLIERMEAMKKGFEQQDVISKFICAGLSGAASRISDPKEAAEFAIACANQIIMTFESYSEPEAKASEVIA